MSNGITSTDPFKYILEFEHLFSDEKSSLQKIIDTIIKELPKFYKYPEYVEIEITLYNEKYSSENFVFTPWLISEKIQPRGNEIGIISVAYRKFKDKGEVFTDAEKEILKVIADRLSNFILVNELKNIFTDFKKIKEKRKGEAEWSIILKMIRRTDPPFFARIARKFLHTLSMLDIEEANQLMRQSSLNLTSDDEDERIDENRPLKKKKINNYDQYINAILKLTQEHFDDEEIYQKIEKWLQEEKSVELIKVLEHYNSSLNDIADSIRKYYLLAPEKSKISLTTVKGLRVALLRRLFTEDLEFIKIAKEEIKLTDFYTIIQKMIYPPSSHGSLGGKSTGMFLAFNIIRNEAERNPEMKEIKIPRTWFIASDGVLSFMHYNNLEEALEQKYKEIEEVRIEYPHIVQLFKNSEFPPQMLKGLSAALDDFGETPLIVRSSSLLEDQIGAAFSGKYKSLFLANQGTKEERLNALTDAVAEVYASTFGPDPIEYRSERGLLDFHEEMGVMIQEVVGKKVDKYYFPAYAGVAFSNNEFRWSPRIKREDGLIRLVPGLGTRAVDRTGNDYPVLVTPGQPNLRVNVSFDEVVRYAPKMIDVINLETNEFETVNIHDIIKEYGDKYPDVKNVFSMIEGNIIRNNIGLMTDFEKEEFVVTFDNLLNNTNFIKRMGEILNLLKERMFTPVDVEFASDGETLYLLQCRPQSFTKDSSPDKIPKNVKKEKILFTANRFISNGRVPEITHLVYIDPIKYSEQNDVQVLKKIGRAVGALNKILPRRKFILMGPGRWGSRGDIKLGVNVTYSDINNTAMLIEVAKQKGNYVPDLSFGTHFFQDLVEASIRYLPLYPDDEDVIFNEKFFEESENILETILPDFAFLKDYIKVIDVPENHNGMIVRILMNGDEDRGMALLLRPGQKITRADAIKEPLHEESGKDISSIHIWLQEMVKRLAKDIELTKFGIIKIFEHGKLEDKKVELIFLMKDKRKEFPELACWLKGWNASLAHMVFLKYGKNVSDVLEITLIDEEDLKKSDVAIKLKSSNIITK